MKYICKDCGAVRTKSGTDKVVECFECDGHAMAEGYTPPPAPEYMARSKEFREKLEQEKLNETQTET